MRNQLISYIKNKFIYSRKFRKPRIWSNQILRQVASSCSGDVINVSGWDDNDKDGGCYRDYFVNASSYCVSNFPGERGFQGRDNEILLDLEQPLDARLLNRFDTVFNHTTLEHIYDVNTAFRNLCLMNREKVIIVVPFAQEMHFNKSFKDYWRFSPYVIERMFRDNGITLIYITANEIPRQSIYIVAVGTKKPNKNIEQDTQSALLDERVFNHLGERLFSPF
ncbi:MAG: hypothetical protein WCK01_01750 [Candidatus Uhrbacteria bacterium]